MIAPDRRVELVVLLGAEAESIVFTYGSCARADSYAQLLRGQQTIDLLDRFTGQRHPLAGAELAAFAELTLANELDVLDHEPALIEALVPLLAACRRLASAAARADSVVRRRS